MSTSQNLKKIVRDKYAEIVTQKSSCCSPSSCCSETDYSSFNLDYSKLDGYMSDADLNLGCGLPTEFAGIKKGDTVVDLGSGAGNDVFVARQLTGENGRIIGVDFTNEMIQQAVLNNEKLGFKNVEFVLGDIENIPLDNNTADVVVSNCVLNLVPDKEKAFQEIMRILKPGGHFCVSDIVLEGVISEKLKKSAEMYAGCVAGALQKEEYLHVIREAGFNDVEVKQKREIVLPKELLESILSDDELKDFKENDLGIYSITVVGEKMK